MLVFRPIRGFSTAVFMMTSNNKPMKTINLLRWILPFCLISASVRSAPAPEEGKVSGEVIASHEVYRVEKHFDTKSRTWYFLTHIRHKDDQGNLVKLRNATARAPAGEPVREFALRTKSLLAFNASMGRKPGRTDDGGVLRSPVGIQIIDGEIIQELNTRVFTLGIKENNELVAYPSGTSANAMIKDGSIHALTAFTPLIENHQPVADELLDRVPNFRQKHPRQIIAQMGNLDLLFLSCGGRGFGGEGMTSEDVIRVLMNAKVKFAFMLDGGGSVSTVIEGELITPKIDAKGTQERLRPNFLYVP